MNNPKLEPEMLAAATENLPPTSIAEIGAHCTLDIPQIDLRVTLKLVDHYDGLPALTRSDGQSATKIWKCKVTLLIPAVDYDQDDPILRVKMYLSGLLGSRFSRVTPSQPRVVSRDTHETDVVAYFR